jgi:hypothetical protein
MAEEMVA